MSDSLSAERVSTAAAAANCTAAALLPANASGAGALPPACGSSGLSIEEAYLVLGLCNVLVKQFNVFPRAVKSFDEALVSFRRVERFLLLPEARPHQHGRPPALEVLQKQGSAVAMPAFVMLDETSSELDVVVLWGVTASWSEGPVAKPEDMDDAAEAAAPPRPIARVLAGVRRTRRNAPRRSGHSTVQWARPQ